MLAFFFLIYAIFINYIYTGPSCGLGSHVLFYITEFKPGRIFRSKSCFQTRLSDNFFFYLSTSQNISDDVGLEFYISDGKTQWYLQRHNT